MNASGEIAAPGDLRGGVNGSSRRGLERGARLLPQAVSSPIRAFSEVITPPILIERGAGGHVWDVDGNEYIDLMLGLGPMILGHADPATVAALRRQSELGGVFACSTEIEYRLAELILEGAPFADQMRFVCSGTEAAMTAVRLARAHTERPGLVKFEGSYHGHSDALLAGGSARAAATADDSVRVLPYDDPDSLREAFDLHGNEIAAAIVEPIGCNAGLRLPGPEFLAALREVCDESGALLIFDEVVTGFRFRYGSVAPAVGVNPDLVVFGKIVGGGLPVGAYAGRRRVMRLLDVGGTVFQGGTFAGNPLTMAAGVATLEALRDPGVYGHLDHLGAELERGLRGWLDQTALASCALTRIGSAASLVPQHGAGGADRDVYARLHFELVCAGILIPPSADEPLFLSTAHTTEDIGRFCHAAGATLNRLLGGSVPGGAG